jgi:hypothetical protein
MFAASKFVIPHPTVVALLHFDGTNGSTTFTDSSRVAKNFTSTAGAALSTTQFKFGTASLATGGSTSYAFSPNNVGNPFTFGLGDFTIECWLYANSTMANNGIYDGRTTGGTNNCPCLSMTSGKIGYFVNGSFRITAGSALTLTTWQHVALCRASGNTKLFIEGTQVGSTYVDANPYLGTNFRPIILNSVATTIGFDGYMDELRVTKGYARYTSNFTPPTAALTADM